jgi:hypothetical protein
MQCLTPRVLQQPRVPGESAQPTQSRLSRQGESAQLTGTEQATILGIFAVFFDGGGKEGCVELIISSLIFSNLSFCL